jgi:hypothetical protein
VPGGNFNCEFYFSVNSNAHNPYVYAELYKYDGTTFTLLGSSQSVPEYLTNGTTLSPYYFAVPVATAALTITDRLAIRIYANVDTRTVTLHTENNHLCQVVTTFSKGLTSLNNLTRQVQFLATGTSGTDFAISSSTATHTFNLPVASATNTGKLSSTDWSTFNGKQAALSFTAPLINTSNTISIPVATASVDGYLDNADWTIFNNKQNAITLTTTGTSGAATLVGATLNIPNYAPDLSGYVTLTTAQTISGQKTFSSSTINDAAILIKHGTNVSSSGYTGIGATTTGLILSLAAGGSGSLIFNTSNNYQYTFPSATGTLALTSDLSGYVTISTTQTITGAKTFTQNLALDGNGSNAGTLLLKSNTALPTAIGYTSLNTTSNTIYLTTYVSNPKTAAFDLSGITDNTIKTFTLPNTNGTIALTSDLSAYLPLIGGTLTGTLTGTNARFSGDATIGSTAAALSPLQVVATGTIVRLGEQSGTTGKQFLIGIDATSGRSELQSVWQGTSFTSLVLQPSGGNVGIATTTPTNKLTISNNGNAVVAFRINDTNANASFLSFNASNTDSAIIAGGTSAIPFDIYTGGVMRLSIAATGAATFSSTITAAGLSKIGDVFVGGRSGTYAAYSDGVFGDNLHLGATSGGGAVYINTALSRNLIINPVGGQIGIGITPTGTWGLQMYGNGTSSGVARIQLQNSSTGSADADGGGISMEGIDFVTRNNESGVVKWELAGTERMVIASTGYITTTSTGDGIRATLTGSSGTAFVSYLPSTAFYSAYFLVGGNTAGYIDHPTGSTTRYYTGPSDERLKSNIKNWDENVLDLFKDINPKTYNHNIDNNESIVYKGFIAQEMVDKFPEAYGIDKDGYYGFNPSGYIPYLVKAIQELKAEIDELKNK